MGRDSTGIWISVTTIMGYSNARVRGARARGDGLGHAANSSAARGGTSRTNPCASLVGGGGGGAAAAAAAGASGGHCPAAAGAPLAVPSSFGKAGTGGRLPPSIG